MKTVPFNYMHENGNAYCPKCSAEMERESNIDRTICNGGFVKQFFGCPKEEHFHRKCPHCEATWFEETFENSKQGAAVALEVAFESAEKADLSEEFIINKWRLRHVRNIMES